eukprot:gene13122-8968_t
MFRVNVVALGIGAWIDITFFDTFCFELGYTDSQCGFGCHYLTPRIVVIVSDVLLVFTLITHWLAGYVTDAVFYSGKLMSMFGVMLVTANNCIRILTLVVVGLDGCLQSIAAGCCIDIDMLSLGYYCIKFLFVVTFSFADCSLLNSVFLWNSYFVSVCYLAGLLCYFAEPDVHEYCLYKVVCVVSSSANCYFKRMKATDLRFTWGDWIVVFLEREIIRVESCIVCGLLCFHFISRYRPFSAVLLDVYYRYIVLCVLVIWQWFVIEFTVFCNLCVLYFLMRINLLEFDLVNVINVFYVFGAVDDMIARMLWIVMCCIVVLGSSNNLFKAIVYLPKLQLVCFSFDCSCQFCGCLFVAVHFYYLLNESAVSLCDACGVFSVCCYFDGNCFFQIVDIGYFSVLKLPVDVSLMVDDVTGCLGTMYMCLIVYDLVVYNYYVIVVGITLVFGVLEVRLLVYTFNLCWDERFVVMLSLRVPWFVVDGLRVALMRLMNVLAYKGKRYLLAVEINDNMWLLWRLKAFWMLIIYDLLIFNCCVDLFLTTIWLLMMRMMYLHILLVKITSYAGRLLTEVDSCYCISLTPDELDTSMFLHCVCCGFIFGWCYCVVMSICLLMIFGRYLPTLLPISQTGSFCRIFFRHFLVGLMFNFDIRVFVFDYVSLNGFLIIGQFISCNSLIVAFGFVLLLYLRIDKWYISFYFLICFRGFTCLFVVCLHVGVIKCCCDFLLGCVARLWFDGLRLSDFVLAIVLCTNCCVPRLKLCMLPIGLIPCMGVRPIVLCGCEVFFVMGIDSGSFVDRFVVYICVVLVIVWFAIDADLVTHVGLWLYLTAGLLVTGFVYVWIFKSTSVSFKIVTCDLGWFVSEFSFTIAGCHFDSWWLDVVCAWVFMFYLPRVMILSIYVFWNVAYLRWAAIYV